MKKIKTQKYIITAFYKGDLQKPRFFSTYEKAFTTIIKKASESIRVGTNLIRFDINNYGSCECHGEYLLGEWNGWFKFNDGIYIWKIFDVNVPNNINEKGETHELNC
ncbi:MAG: hypothetical protein LBI03_07695 [Clostridiales bacterium]|nr:hypothetical protein [Clostridiales bacterium]